MAYRAELEASQNNTAPNQQPPSSSSDLLEDAARNLLSSFLGSSGDPYPRATREGRSPPSSGISWNLYEATEPTHLAPSAEEHSIALIARGLLERFDELSGASDDEPAERSDIEGEELDPNEPIVCGARLVLIFLFFYSILSLYS